MFFALLIKIIPLYVLIFLGFFAVKVLKADKDTISQLLVYIIVPVVIFFGAYNVDINLTYLSLPIVLFFGMLLHFFTSLCDWYAGF